MECKLHGVIVLFYVQISVHAWNILLNLKYFKIKSYSL